MADERRSVTVTFTRLEKGAATCAEYVEAYEGEPTLQNLLNLTWTLFDAASRIWCHSRLSGRETPDDRHFAELAFQTMTDIATRYSVPPKRKLVQCDALMTTSIPDKLHPLYWKYRAIFDGDSTIQMLLNITKTLFEVTARLWQRARQLEHLTPTNENFAEFAASLLATAGEMAAKGVSLVPARPTPGN